MHRSSLNILIKAIGLFTLIVSIFTVEVNSQTYPLRVHSSNRYLEDQTGTPFFLNADAAWSLITQLSYTQADLYLTDRSNRGFNGILVNLIERSHSDLAPANIHNIPPFTGTAFTTPNNPYFSHADSVIDRANKLGIVVFLCPIYLGYNCGQEGWCAEVQSASTADMKLWGQYVGNRYKNYSNIVWIIGGDTDPTTVKEKLDSMIVGMMSVDNIYPRIYSAHNEPESESIKYWSGNTWFNLNGIYTYSETLYNLAQTAYGRIPTIPFIMMEGIYENENSSTSQKLRAQAYWSVLSGGCGHIFGNCPLWAFGAAAAAGSCAGSDWISSLSSPGSVSMTNFSNLFKSRNWHKLVPDINASVLTAGAQSGITLATVAYTTDSSSIIGYIPTQRSITINPAVLMGDSIHVLWYNPSNGVFTASGTFSKVSRSYNPPSAGDWVLVIDSGRSNSLPTGVHPIESIPLKFKVHQNYPNPFNPWTIITYELPEKSQVRLTIFDISGRKIATLVDSLVEAGTHQARWTVHATSGIYFYRFEAIPTNNPGKRYTNTKKMVLIR